MIGRPFFRIRFFSLVNIIMNKEIVKEFLQFKLAKKIRGEIDKILTDRDYYNRMLDDYTQLADKIGKAGTSERVAKSMYEYIMN